jgi:rubrerythrin
MEIMNYAINMELDGEKFYNDLAIENRGNSLYPIFKMLSCDESRHAKVLREKKQGLHAVIEGENLASVDNVFDGSSGFDFESVNPGQVD